MQALATASPTDSPPRYPLRDHWNELLGAASPAVRELTTEVRGGTRWERQRILRGIAFPLPALKPAERILLILDEESLPDADAIAGRDALGPQH